MGALEKAGREGGRSVFSSVPRWTNRTTVMSDWCTWREKEEELVGKGERGSACFEE